MGKGVGDRRSEGQKFVDESLVEDFVCEVQSVHYAKPQKALAGKEFHEG